MSVNGGGESRPPAVSVVVAPDCPHRDLAVTRASQALNDAGFPTTVDVLVVTTPEEADVVGFGGSPTLLIDGRDPFPAPESTTWACRLYPTEEGLEGAPSLTQLQQALHR